MAKPIALILFVATRFYCFPPFVISLKILNSDRQSIKKRGRTPNEENKPTETNQHPTTEAKRTGQEEEGTDPQATDTGTEAHHQTPRRRTTTNDSPAEKHEPGAREAARRANEPAATRDGKNATTTQREKDRDEGRKDTNDAPTARAQGTSQETNGAGQGTGDEATAQAPEGKEETKDTTKNPQRRNNGIS